MKKIKTGMYQHYKGGKYKVLGIARHSETLEELVLYQHTDAKKEMWVRPYRMFFEKVKIEGKMTPRFKPLRKK